MTVFDPFGQSFGLPSHLAKQDEADRGIAAPGKTGHLVYRSAIVGFWVIVGVIVAARIVIAAHGNIFDFGS